MLYFTFYIRRWGCFGDILGLEADEELPTVWNDVEYCWVAIISLVIVGLLGKRSSSSDILQNVVNQVKEM